MSPRSYALVLMIGTRALLRSCRNTLRVLNRHGKSSEPALIALIWQYLVAFGLVGSDTVTENTPASSARSDLVIPVDAQKLRHFVDFCLYYITKISHMTALRKFHRCNVVVMEILFQVSEMELSHWCEFHVVRPAHIQGLPDEAALERAWSERFM